MAFAVGHHEMGGAMIDQSATLNQSSVIKLNGKRLFPRGPIDEK